MRKLIPLVLGKLYLPSRLKNMQLAKFLPLEVRRIGKSWQNPSWSNAFQ